MEKDFLNEIISRSITPNEFYLIQCLFSNEEPKVINKSLELRKLQSKNYVNDKGELTVKANELKHLLTGAIPIATGKIEDTIAEYISLFPKIKLPSNKYARSHRTNIESAFSWFFKNYDYTWETILKATQYYVREYEEKNYLYMMTSQYFVCKTKNGTKESELANYCEMYLDGTLGQSPDHFSEKVV